MQNTNIVCERDTIFAQSSAKGKSGVTVFRVSGANALDCLTFLCKNFKKISLVPRKVYLKKIYSTVHDVLIDNALIIYFNSPHSFTGEDIVEIQTHGSIIITKMILEELSLIDNFRMANPGEFARRAFLNNKFDLTSAEGLSDLIESETVLQHKQAIKQFSGVMYGIYDSWRSKLIKIQSLLEAYIDFPDEDIPPHIMDDAKLEINFLRNDLKTAVNDNRRGERLRSGITVSILGHPNVGKSSLINYLTNRDVSIVSDIAGTTRDIVETYIDIGGYPIIIADTAGIRKTEDKIESLGIERAIKKASESDLKIVLFDQHSKNFYETFNNIIDQNTILVRNKIDTDYSYDSSQNSMHFCDLYNISLKENIGLEKLLKGIEYKLSSIVSHDDNSIITRVRHRNQVNDALGHLMRCDIDGDLVCAAEDIRLSIRSLSILVGKIEVDEILGEIFGNFCIGK